MYALFSCREVMIVGQIADLNFQITQLCQNQMNLATLGGVIGDGSVTQQEFSSSDSTTQYGINQVLSEADAASQLSGQAFVQSATDGSGTMVFDQSYLTNIQAQISNTEKQIDTKRKILETRLAALQAELESVEQGKQQGIKMSTPRYA